MSYTALARYRRLPAQEPTLRLIAFQLRHNWFCLPLAMARRVIPAVGQNSAVSLGLTQLHHENVPILNIADRVYHAAPLLPGYEDTTPPVEPPSSHLQSIVVIDSPRFGLLGLLTDGIPSLKRARQSAFSPIPATYLRIKHFQGINILVTLSETEPPLFLLEIDALLP